jgi:hypothetical protein
MMNNKIKSGALDMEIKMEICREGRNALLHVKCATREIENELHKLNISEMNGN